MYEKIEPFGEVRADLRMGIISSTFANVNRTDKKQKVWKPSDFMPDFDTELEDDINEEVLEDRKMVEVNKQLAFIQGYAASIGSKIQYGSSDRE